MKIKRLWYFIPKYPVGSIPARGLQASELALLPPQEPPALPNTLLKESSVNCQEHCAVGGLEDCPKGEVIAIWLLEQADSYD